MHNGIEKEYKILVNEEQFTTLCSSYKDLIFMKQTNIYYDTYDHAIERKHGAMRIREKNGSFIFTLKMFHGDDLMEHECTVLNNSLEVFDIKEIKDVLSSYDIQGPFMELASCITYRAMVVNEYAELCFDINEYRGMKDYEIEYEYLREHDGLSAFQKILEPISVTYTKNCASKIQRTLGNRKCW